MKALENAQRTLRGAATSRPSDALRVAVTFRRPKDGLGPTKLDARISTRSVLSLAPDPIDMDRALLELHRRGLETSIRGRLTASVRCTRREYETLFGTALAPFRLPAAAPAQFQAFYFPPDGAPWNPDPAVAAMIDDAYIQWPHIHFAKRQPRSSPSRAAGVPSATPPARNRYHLNVPADVARLINAAPIHQEGRTGRGVRIAMVDSGFAHSHPFFATHSYTSTVTLAPGATNRATDANGHGTGESANIFAIAPGATFIGIKVDNDENPYAGATLLEGFQEALRHDPHVISVSLGYDLRDPGTGAPMTSLPNSLVALEAEIQAAVASGIVVVFAAGNGHYSFPGQMAEVISAGGVFVDQGGRMRASDYASGFKSRIYSGRNVPDFCGLVGLLPYADYIMLPIPPGCDIDREEGAHDGTTRTDGWGVFSGTSAAAPQLAAVCALLLEKNPGLTPGDVKAVLKRTARDVATGNANPASDPRGAGLKASRGLDGATGAGLVDAFAAFQQV
ncbi:MAG TPA: S8 family serine peptidase [Vicinamibacterales bacterium]|nr:S8 family serine peptidase [Vicinamibacterales bacterium]